MKLYVRFIDNRENGVFLCKSFKAYEGKLTDIQTGIDFYESFPELVIEFDNGEVLSGILDFEAL